MKFGVPVQCASRRGSSTLPVDLVLQKLLHGLLLCDIQWRFSLAVYYADVCTLTDKIPAKTWQDVFKRQRQHPNWTDNCFFGIFGRKRKLRRWNGASFYRTFFTETSWVQAVICILIKKNQWSGPTLRLLVNSMDSCHWVHRLVNFEGVAVSCLKDHFSVDLGVINTSPSITSCVRFKNSSTRETRLHRPALTTVWITLHIQSCSTSSFSLEIKHSCKTPLDCKYRIWVSFFLL